jgi:hypothetical protein
METVLFFYENLDIMRIPVTQCRIPVTLQMLEKYTIIKLHLACDLVHTRLGEVTQRTNYDGRLTHQALQPRLIAFPSAPSRPTTAGVASHRGNNATAMRITAAAVFRYVAAGRMTPNSMIPFRRSNLTNEKRSKKPV